MSVCLSNRLRHFHRRPCQFARPEQENHKNVKIEGIWKVHVGYWSKSRSTGVVTCSCISEMLRGPVELLLRSRFRAQFSCAPLSLRFILPTTTRIPGSQIAPLSVSLLLCFYPLSLPPACSLLHFKRPVSSSSLHFSIFVPFSPFSFFPSRAASPELQGIRKGNKGFA